MTIMFCSVVVLDGLFGETERTELLALLTSPSWDHSHGPGTNLSFFINYAHKSFS